MRNRQMTRSMEPMEARRLLAVVASFAVDTLYVYGDDDANGIAVTVNNQGTMLVKQYVGQLNYQAFYSVAASKVKSIKIWGRGGPDTISIDKTVIANATINGGAGGDWIASQAWGTNFLYGNDADASVPDDGAKDVLLRGGYKSALHGQKGDDEFYDLEPYTQGAAADSIYGGDGNDKMSTYGLRAAVFLGGNGNDLLVAQPFAPKVPDREPVVGVDGGGNGMTAYSVRDPVVAPNPPVVTFFGNAGADAVDFSRSYVGVTVKLDGAFVTGNSWLIGKYTLGSDIESVTGTAWNDDITVGQMANNTAYKVFGLAGNDRIRGGRYADELQGGSGHDTIEGSLGNDTLGGGIGNDWLVGDGGDDHLRGGGDDDTLIGGEGHDRLYGESGVDSLRGGAGNDRLIGGRDSDLLDARDYGQFGIDALFGGDENGTNVAGIDGAYRDATDIVLNVDVIN